MLLVNMTQKMCDKAILENGGTLKSVPNCYKNQQMFDKAVEIYTLMNQNLLLNANTQKMCDKAVDTCPTTIKYAPDRFNTREMCGKAVDKYFVFESVLDEFKTQDSNV